MKDNFKPFPGIVKFITWLKGNNFKIAIASMNIKKNITQDLTLLGLVEEFNVITTVEDVKNHKPDPEFLLVTAKKLGLKPEECVYVDDSPNGIETAHKIGMKVLSIQSPKRKSSDYVGHDFLCTSFIGVVKKIKLLPWMQQKQLYDTSE